MWLNDDNCHFWVHYPFNFFWLGSISTRWRKNKLEYVKKKENWDGARETDYKKEVYLLLSAQIISERLYQFWTNAKSLLSLMQYWKMKQLDMIVVWSDAGECFQLHCASIYAWCFNTFLHLWELHWNSRTSVLVVTFCLITPEQRWLLIFFIVIGITSNCFQTRHWDNRVSRCRSLCYH